MQIDIEGQRKAAMHMCISPHPLQSSIRGCSQFLRWQRENVSAQLRSEDGMEEHGKEGCMARGTQTHSTCDSQSVALIHYGLRLRLRDLCLPFRLLRLLRL